MYLHAIITLLNLGLPGRPRLPAVAGKCVVYGAAGAPPSWLLPITVDVGTNNAALRADPLYVGQPQQRVRGQPYQQLMLEVVQGLQKRFNRQVLVHWEDLAVSNAFNVLHVRACNHMHGSLVVLEGSGGLAADKFCGSGSRCWCTVNSWRSPASSV
jgi:hypothetical protein